MTKNVVLIMPQFYNYENKIKEIISNLGFNIRVYHDSPTTVFNAIYRRLSMVFGCDIVYRNFNRKLFNQIEKENEKVSHFIVIKGDALDVNRLKKCKEKLLIKNGRDVYYSWDSFSNLLQGKNIGSIFSNRFTFDSEDVKHNKDWGLLPLFFINDYDDNVYKCNNLKFDIACISGLSLQKYELLQQIIKANPGCRIFCKLYLNRYLFWFKRIINKKFRNMDKSFVIHKSLPSNKVAKIYRLSKAILDLPNSKQSGLSMRSIESVGLRKKLVTTNKYIKEYDFYNESNIYVLDNHLVISDKWFKEKYLIKDEVRQKYSLGNWINILLGINAT